MFLAVLFAGGYLFVDYSNTLRVKEINLSLSGNGHPSREKTALFLSDLHFSSADSGATTHLFHRIQALKPDLIFLTGDYVRWFGKADDYAVARNFLNRLAAPLGVFATLGDSDYSNRRQNCLFCHSDNLAIPPVETNIHWLRDRFTDIAIGQDSVRIIGIGVDSGKNRKEDVLDLLRRGRKNIVLSHSSTLFDFVDNDEDVLYLAGDTHGGQLYLPTFVWKLWSRKPDPDYMYGLFSEGRKKLYVTSGVGTSDINFRLGVPPEIVLLRFK